jgi:hypothetical protein
MPTIYELYESVLRESEYARVNEVALRALICDIQGYSEMSDFYLRNDEKVVDLPLFLAHLARFLNGEPYQYIIQKATFLIMISLSTAAFSYPDGNRRSC